VEGEERTRGEEERRSILLLPLLPVVHRFSVLSRLRREAEKPSTHPTSDSKTRGAGAGKSPRSGGYVEGDGEVKTETKAENVGEKKREEKGRL